MNLDAKKIAEEIIAHRYAVPIPVSISNRHVHLSRQAGQVLLGDRPLTVKKYLGQPGQFAAEEVLMVKGPKGFFEAVRVVGPERAECQLELSVSDCRKLGVGAVLRDSGRLEGTPGLYLMGPEGVWKMEQGVIVAQRHIHMVPEEATKYGVKDQDLVRIRYNSGPRKGILGDVLIRVSSQAALECHLDREEANALGIKNIDTVLMEIGGI